MNNEMTARPLRLRRPPLALAHPLDATVLVSATAAVVGVALLLAALATSPLRLDGLGIAHALPPAYYLGLALLPAGCALLWGRERVPLLVLVLPLVAFVAVVWLTPLALEGTARFRASYENLGFVSPLLGGSALDPARFIYDSWPAFPLLMAAIISATHVHIQTLLGWFPAVVVLLYLLPLGAFLIIGTREDDAEPAGRSRRATRSDAAGGGSNAAEGALARRAVPAIPRFAWVGGIWFFLALDWTGQDYFSPQAVAYLLYLAWLALLARVIIRREGRFTASDGALLLALYLAIVLTHVLTALVALVGFGVMAVVRLHRRPSLVLALAAVFVTWQAFPAAPFYAAHSNELVGALGSIGAFIARNLSGRVAGSPDHELAALARIAATMLGFGFAFLSAFVAWRASGRLGRAERFALVQIAGIALVTPMSVYGGEMLIRALLFSLPLLALLVARAMRVPAVRVGLAAVVVALGLAQVVTHYGNELYDYVSPGELQGYQQIASLGPANVFGGYPGAIWEGSSELAWRNPFPPTAQAPLNAADFLAPQLHRWSHPNWPVYVVLTRGDAAAATLFYDQPDFVPSLERRLNSDSNFERVYANPDVTIYRWLGAPPPGTAS